MNDDLHPEHDAADAELLASASIDGALDDEQAALVQASPQVQALALSYLDLRAELADVDEVPPATRESALAAALAVFDELHSPASSAAVPAAAATVHELAARRRWSTPVLAAAAAVVLLGVVGVATLGTRGSSTKTSATVAQAANTGGDVAGGAPGPAPTSTIGAINSSADYSLQITDPSQLRDIATPPAAPEVAHTTSVDTVPAAPATTAAKSPTDATRCLAAHQVFLAEITYKGTPAIAARDTVTGVTQAIDEQCKVLVEVSP